MRNAAHALLAIAIALTVTACAHVPSGTASGTPADVQTSAAAGDPAIVPGPGLPRGGTPPTDPAAIALAREWMSAATPLPGVRVLDGAPASGPTQPATTFACDWLVRATKWWSTDSAHAAAASAWLTEHPVKGLGFGGTMTGPGDRSAIFENARQTRNNSMGFEFVPDGDTVTIRIDVAIVPVGAKCAHTGLSHPIGGSSAAK